MINQDRVLIKRWAADATYSTGLEGPDARQWSRRSWFQATFSSVLISHKIPTSKLTVRPWQIRVGRLVSIENWWFAGSMFIYHKITSNPKVTPTLRGQENPPKKRNTWFMLPLALDYHYTNWWVKWVTNDCPGKIQTCLLQDIGGDVTR